VLNQQSRRRPLDPALPLVSVITPVHNGAEHLQACIESVFAQDYPNWEYVIVDNASTDGTAKIIAGYANNEPHRIRVYRNETLLSAAQNHNVALARISTASKYCKFLQADDWLFPECLSKMVAVAETHPSVSIVGAYRLDDTRVNLDGLPYPSTVVRGRELCRATLLRQLYVFGSPTSLLIRSNLLRKRETLFDDTVFPRHWDLAACYELLRETDFGFVHQVLTYTRRPTNARTTDSQRIGSYRGDELIALSIYGPEFLSEAEYVERYRQDVANYYRFLARNLFRRDVDFWNYHRRTCQSLGLSACRGRLLIYAAAVGFHAFPAIAARGWRAVTSKA
jgi:glycosyltransferase involved in cell wall biosynthesis